MSTFQGAVSIAAYTLDNFIVYWIKQSNFQIFRHLILICIYKHPVIYWPSTEPSIKRCTCVNKQRNSGSRWAWDNYITRCHRRLGISSIWSWSQLGDKMPAWESACRLRACGPQWPMVEQPQPRWGRSAAMVSSLSPSPAHTQLTSTLSRIKCERYIFIKKYVCSLKFVIYCWLCFRIYLYVYMYLAIQHSSFS